MAGDGPSPESLLCADEDKAPEQHPGPEPLSLELHALRSQLESTVSPGGLIGVSLRMRTIHNLIGKARDHNFPVIVLGETGTGKENFVARCIALGSGPTLRDEDGCLIPEEIGNNILAETDTHRLDSIERYTIVKALKEANGDKIAAARILGIGKTTIYRKLRQYGQNPI